MHDATSIMTKLPDGFKPGLEGVIAGTSEIGDVDAVHDALIYRGYPAHELAEMGSYDEASYLLIHGKLPSRDELESYQERMRENHTLPPSVLSILSTLPKNSNSMNLLRLAVGLLATTDPDADSNDLEANKRKAERLIAALATVVAAISRLQAGLKPVDPHPQLGHAANFLYMATGREPDPEVAKILDSTIVLYAEHGFNASTFAALVTASTLADMHSAVASAIGALKGPLHGGANEGAINMLLKIGDIKNVEPWLKDALARKEKIMGFGHRVYKRQDSRAPFMRILAEKMAQRVGDKKLFPMSVALEEAVKREKGLFTNVDYFCAVVYNLMGLPVEIYTAMFAMARMAGWTAHIIEQHMSNRLIRPDCFYNGPRNLNYIPLDQRL
jgi:citrate synthase